MRSRKNVRKPKEGTLGGPKDTPKGGKSSNGPEGSDDSNGFAGSPEVADEEERGKDQVEESNTESSGSDDGEDISKNDNTDYPHKPQLSSRRSLHPQSPESEEEKRKQRNSSCRDQINSPPLINNSHTKKDIEWYNILSYGGGVIVLVGLAAVLIYLCFASFSGGGGGEKCISQEESLSNIGSLTRERLAPCIPEQSDSFWSVLEVEISRLVNGNSQPSCILLTYPQNCRSYLLPTIKCINEHITYLLTNKRLSGDVTTAADYSSRSSLEDRYEALYKKQIRSSVLVDINDLSLDSAQIFYKICDDNPDPAYPGTLLLLTLPHQQDEVDKDWVEEKLFSDWSVEKRHAQLLPIMSRITYTEEINLETDNNKHSCVVTDLCIKKS